MWTSRLKIWRFTLCAMLVVSTLALTVRGDEEVPSESQCRPYIEKALKHLESGDAEAVSVENNDSSEVGNEKDDSSEVYSIEDSPSVEVAEGSYVAQGSDGESKEDLTVEDNNSNEVVDDDDSKENATEEDTDENGSEEEKNESAEDGASDDDGDDDDDKQEDNDTDSEQTEEEKDTSTEVKDGDSEENQEADSKEEEAGDSQETKEDSEETKDDTQEESAEEEDKDADSKESEVETSDDEEGESQQESSEKADDEDDAEKEDSEGSQEEESVNAEEGESEEKEEKADDDGKSEEDASEQGDEPADESTDEESEEGDEKSEEVASDSQEDDEGAPEEDLLLVGEVPENLRSRSHIAEILRLNEDATESEQTIDKSAEIILRDLKKLYENSIKPLEGLYKYRDLSNRHFGDPEIFSKPLVLFMGPWSGGKSTILNYLTGLEFTEWSLRSGAEPSPAYFNILMHGKEPEVLDGTQLAADWTFSGLQKFGQGLEERLRGLKHPSKILEKVNIVEIPGILEVRKQVSRVFPFNDACQWFIDRADIIFLVYDPSKLDVGPETEAILDQLKGRESQTRIVLNKADTVKPEELMRVQSALIWNISPLMSSAQPPVMYTVSLWSMPFEPSAPARLLLAQERELLKDLRMAIDKRIENKIASARRFAVRVRNHAKMVDCYLTTYYNHKTIFGNKKLIADAIIENPQNYHIYEGLSTLTNISRYDLPDPETYRDFFRLNSLYEFQQLSATCTYFRGCPINRLDVAIAYDLPELVGKYKKMVETVTPQGMPKS